MLELDEGRCRSKAISFAASLGRTDIRVKSYCLADLVAIARHYSANHLLGIEGCFVEVRLLSHSPDDWKRRVIGELDAFDAIEASKFLVGPEELLVICNENSIVFTAWPEFDFD